MRTMQNKPGKDYPEIVPIPQKPENPQPVPPKIQPEEDPDRWPIPPEVAPDENPIPEIKPREL